MDGKFGKILLAAILAIAGWSAFQIHTLSNVVPALRGSSEVVIRSTFRSSFIDKSGESHEVITTRGEVDPNETITDCVKRHAKDFNTLKESFR